MFHEKSLTLFPERSLATDCLPEGSLQTLPLSHPDNPPGSRPIQAMHESPAATTHLSPQEASPGDHGLAVKLVCTSLFCTQQRTS